MLHRTPLANNKVWLRQLLDIYSPVEIVKEREDEEGHLAPGFFLAEFERVSVHDGRWIIEKLLSVCGAVEVPAENGKKHEAGSAS